MYFAIFVEVLCCPSFSLPATTPLTQSSPQEPPAVPSHEGSTETTQGQVLRQGQWAGPRGSSLPASGANTGAGRWLRFRNSEGEKEVHENGERERERERDKEGVG